MGSYETFSINLDSARRRLFGRIGAHPMNWTKTRILALAETLGEGIQPFGITADEMTDLLSHTPFDFDDLSRIVSEHGSSAEALREIATFYPEPAAPTNPQPSLLDTPPGTVDAAILQLVAAVTQSSAPKTDEKLAERITELEQRLDGFKPREIALTINGTGPKIIAGQHEIFPTVLQIVAANVNVWLAGPAGSGKTSIASAVADALELPFYQMSLGPQTSEGRLMGYNDAHGNYVPSPLFEAFTSGGVLLLDEIDAANPGVLTTINAAVDNAKVSFGGILRDRHENFRVIAAANTWGHGATREYVGRNQLDAATLNRFARVAMDYDEQHERAIAGNDQWTAAVQAVRARVRAQGIRAVISPRQSINGAKMIAAGIPSAQAAEMLIWSSITTDEKAAVCSGLDNTTKKVLGL